jgi:hypothetical protein
MKSPAALLMASALAAAVAGPASAHAIWFAQRSKQVALIYGEGADDLDMVARIPLIGTVEAYDADYRPIRARPRAAGAIVVIDSDRPPTLVTATLQNGVWSRMKGGEFENKGLDQMPGAEVSENNIKYAVTLQAPLTKPLPALPNQTLQIIPVGDIPTTLGKRLTYKVLFKGKPVAGAAVVNDMVNDPDAKPLMTGADGSVTLPVRNQGLNVVRAVYKGPSEDPAKYRRTDHTATLAFTLAHAPE